MPAMRRARTPSGNGPASARAGIAAGTASPHRPRHRSRAPRRSLRLTSASCLLRAAREDDGELGELPRLRVDVDRAAMLLHHDVVAQRKAQARALAGGLRGEEGREHLVLDLVRDADAVVADPDLDLVAEIARRGRQG